MQFTSKYLHLKIYFCFHLLDFVNFSFNSNFKFVILRDLLLYWNRLWSFWEAQTLNLTINYFQRLKCYNRRYRIKLLRYFYSTFRSLHYYYNFDQKNTYYLVIDCYCIDLNIEFILINTKCFFQFYENCVFQQIPYLKESN